MQAVNVAEINPRTVTLHGIGLVQPVWKTAGFGTQCRRHSMPGAQVMFQAFQPDAVLYFGQQNLGLLPSGGQRSIQLS